MDFELTEEQRLLADSVERLMSDTYDFEARKGFAASAEGWSLKIWRQYAELGLLAIPFAERHGGMGCGPVETMIVMQALGRALALEPYLATVVLGGGLIREGGDEEQCNRLLPRIVSGEWRLAFAHTESTSRHDPTHIRTTATHDGDGWVLDGAKTMVLHGDCADALIITARTESSPPDKSGIGLFLVDDTAHGLLRTTYATIDGRRAADVVMTGVRVGPESVIGEADEALPIIERVIDHAIAALAAEAVGAMAATHERTVEYLKTRVQFGSAIGKYQVLQHRAVDMLIDLEQSRSMAMYGAVMAGRAEAHERRHALAAVKVQIGRSARFIGQQAIQLHGGIGLAIEHDIGHYVQRLIAIDMLFGDAEQHLSRLAAGGGLLAAEA